MRPRGAQQRRGVVGRGAELARQVQHGARPSAAPGERSGRARRPRRSPRVSCRIFASSSGAVQHEVAHAVPRPRLADRAARLDRMHEVDCGIGEHLPHQPHLGDRGAVEMRDAAGPHRAQDRRLGIALHRVHHVAGERRRRRPGVPWSTAAGRRQCIGSSGRSVGDQIVDRGSTIANGGESGDAAGETAERARSGSSGYPRKHAGRTRVARPAIRPTGEMPRGATALRATNSAGAASTSHRGKPVSQHRRLPNDHRPTGDRLDRKGRVTSLLCPDHRELAARAMRQRTAREAMRDSTI